MAGKMLVDEGIASGRWGRGFAAAGLVELVIALYEWHSGRRGPRLMPFYLRIAAIVAVGGGLLVAAFRTRQASSIPRARRTRTGLAVLFLLHASAHALDGAAVSAEHAAMPLFARAITTALFSAAFFLRGDCDWIHEGKCFGACLLGGGVCQTLAFVAVAAGWSEHVWLLLMWGLALSAAGLALLCNPDGLCVCFRRYMVTRVEIARPPADVWRHLTDFEAWGEWCQFIPDIGPPPNGAPSNGGEGSALLPLKVGSPLRFRCVVPNSDGGREFHEHVVVTRWETVRDFAWRGGVGPGATTGFCALGFTGEHRFQLQGLENGSTLLEHTEELSGPMVPFIWAWFNTSVRSAFEELNASLKKRAEGGQLSPLIAA